MVSSMVLGMLMLTQQPQVKPPDAKPRIERWSDAKNDSHSPLVLGKNRANLLLFVIPDCPIANGYAPEVNRIFKEFGGKGIGCYLVYVDSDAKVSEIERHMNDYGYRCPAILDTTQALAKKLGATVSPEAVVIGAKQAILYRGRIDDRVVNYGKTRHRAGKQDLRVALTAILHGERVPVPRTQAVGCFIPNL